MLAARLSAASFFLLITSCREQVVHDGAIGFDGHASRQQSRRHSVQLAERALLSLIVGRTVHPRLAESRDTFKVITRQDNHARYPERTLGRDWRTATSLLRGLRWEVCDNWLCGNRHGACWIGELTGLKGSGGNCFRANLHFTGTESPVRRPDQHESCCAYSCLPLGSADTLAPIIHTYVAGFNLRLGSNKSNRSGQS